MTQEERIERLEKIVDSLSAEVEENKNLVRQALELNEKICETNDKITRHMTETLNQIVAKLEMKGIN